MAGDLPDWFFLIAGFVSAAVVFTIYHVSVWCSRSTTPTATRAGPPQQAALTMGFEGRAIEMTAVHKYRKDMELVGGDGICVVCLSEFEEGEELRTLPHCMHSFHVPCIDLWLLSHMNCPICRSPSLLMFPETQQDLPITLRSAPSSSAWCMVHSNNGVFLVKPKFGINLFIYFLICSFVFLLTHPKCTSPKHIKINIIQLRTKYTITAFKL